MKWVHGGFGFFCGALLLLAQPPKLPSVMHFCAGDCNAGKGATLHWTNGRYATHPGGGDTTFTVEKFTRELVILHRTDSGRFPGKALMTGQISEDGNSIVNGLIAWTYHPCCGLSSGTYKLAWGAAINTVPGNDADWPKAPAPLSAPATALAPAPPPAPQPSEHSENKPASGRAYDLNGIWQRPTRNPQQPLQKVLVVVIGNNIEGINIDRVAFLPPGMEFLKGSSSSPGAYKVFAIGSADTPGITDSKVVQSPETLRAIDADHLDLGGKVTFVRSSKGTSGDVPCDPRNPAHIPANEALARGLIYDYHSNDARTTVCWYRVAAEQGNAQAQLNYSGALMKGIGVAQDSAQGLAWLQKSAMQGNDIAASNLSHEFASGQLVPHSEQRAKYWAARAEITDTRWFHQQVFLPVPSWAADTAGPCDASHPPQVSTAQSTAPAHFDYKADGQPRSWRGSAWAFAQARVAYEARALELAACWFQVAADTPVVEMLPTVADVSQRANVYLGILYVFGLGVKKDPPRGFEYMKKAADYGDKFGLMYLANFYRYGMGTRPDMNQASALVSRVMKDGEGLDAFMRVQGTLLSGEEAMASALSGLSAVAQGTTCQSEEMGAGGVRYLKDCVDHAEEWAVQHMGGRPARHTIDHPEEIWPEHFDAQMPPENKIEAMSGMPIDRHGRKVP